MKNLTGHHIPGESILQKKEHYPFALLLQAIRN